MFVSQHAARAQEKLVLARALQSISKNASYDAIVEGCKEREEEQTRPLSHTFPVKSGYFIAFHILDAKCEFKWDRASKLVQIYPVILWWMVYHWHGEVVFPSHGTILHCKTEY